MIRHITKTSSFAFLVAAAAVVASSTLAPAQAHASYSVNIDCTGFPNAIPNWAGTVNTITVKAHKKNGTVKQLFSGVISNSSCITFGNIIQGFDTDSMSNVKKISVTTNGNDAFWIDSLWLNNGSSFITWGVQNQIGWCVSTDPADGNNSHCEQAKAFTTWDFPTGN